MLIQELLENTHHFRWKEEHPRFMGKDKILTLTGAWEGMVPTLTGNLESPKTPTEGVSPLVWWTQQRTRSQVDSEDETEGLRSQDISKEGGVFTVAALTPGDPEILSTQEVTTPLMWNGPFPRIA